MPSKLGSLVQALRPLLDQALELPPAERRDWLERLRLERPALAGELEALLTGEAELDAQGFLEDEWTLSAPVAAERDPLVHSGRRLGAYTLERPVGQGGMGSVWLGSRSDGRYEGKVAVKLLTLPLLSPVGRERFRREGSALALLTHPNIARLLDAGVTEDPGDESRPYLVLEYVDGLRIDRYADEHRLAPAERLRLFRQVLAAVAHAHASLIVHRDLKPSNILVGADGTVKLLDFGIAKLLDREGAEADRTELTEAGGAPLTPEYAAPEQVTGGAITTATDIYALGVLLYLLLAGVHPTAGAARTPADRLRNLLDTEPPRLSDTIAGGAGRTADEVDDEAARRGATPARLRQRYAGDLDTIVGKALRKEPAARYATVAAFDEDISRYLRDEPVLARPATLRYRAVKFLRRHRVPVAVGIAAALALMVATGVAVHQALEAQRQRDEARVQRDRAIYEARRANASGEFMETLLRSVAPTGRPYTTGELLTRARELLEQDFGEDPRFVARMMIELSERYAAIDDVGQQMALLRRAAELAAGAGDDEALGFAECAMALRGAYHLESTARQHFDRAIRSLARVNAPSTRSRMQCLLAEAQLATNEGPWERALPLARQAVALAEAAGDTVSTAYAEALDMVATQFQAANRWREGLLSQRRVTATLERLGRGRTLDVARTREHEASSLLWLGQLLEADSVIREVQALLQRVDSAFIGPEVTNTSASISLRRERPDSAASAFRRAIVGAGRSGNVALERLSMDGLILAVADLGLGDSARRLLTRRVAAGSEWRRGRFRRHEARVVEAEGDTVRAYRLYQQLLQDLGFPDTSGVPDPTDLRDPGQTFLAAARAALASRDPVAAESLARHTIRLELAMQQDEARSADLGRALLLLARAELAQGDTAGAKEHVRRSMPGLEHGLGSGHPRVEEARALQRRLAQAPIR